MGRGRRRWSAADARSGRVVFVSHCLLNENVRYPGGATCPGAVPKLVIRYVEQGVGLCQIPCPELRAWGGVRKRRLLRLYGLRPLRYRPVRRAALAVAIVWAGRGLFIACLDRALRSRRIAAMYGEHDLVAELTDAGAVAS